MMLPDGFWFSVSAEPDICRQVNLESEYPAPMGKPLSRALKLCLYGGLVFLGLVLLFHDKTVVSAGTYTNSAHGNTSYGVNRSATATVGYTKGHCGHCHEQHASIEGAEPAPQGGTPSKYAIFSKNFTDQTDDFCYNCHEGAGSVQVSFSRTNYNYSYWFGGDTANQTTPNSIYDAFNPASGSAHNLQDILTFVKTKWPATFGNESNPCNACHNPHLSSRGYPIVRPTDRNNIWGDSAGEHMSDYAAAHGGQYQAPYRYNSTVTYEPDGSATTDGSNMPDYVTFCSDCHDSTNVIYSTSLISNLKYINWANPSNIHGQPGDYHGSIPRVYDVNGNTAYCGCVKDSAYGISSGFCRGAPVDGNGCCLYDGHTVDARVLRGSLKPPYSTANYANFILNCTDCHEPHGAIHGQGTATPYLLRKTVNGKYNWSSAGSSWEREFCRSCHYHYEATGSQTFYIAEFDRTVTVDGGHSGGKAGCVGCHFHNCDDHPSYSCSPPGGIGGRAHQF